MYHIIPNVTQCTSVYQVEQKEHTRLELREEAVNYRLKQHSLRSSSVPVHV